MNPTVRILLTPQQLLPVCRMDLPSHRLSTSGNKDCPKMSCTVGDSTSVFTILYFASLPSLLFSVDLFNKYSLNPGWVLSIFCPQGVSAIMAKCSRAAHRSFVKGCWAKSKIVATGFLSKLEYHCSVSDKSSAVWKATWNNK